MFEIADRLLEALDSGRTLAVATAISIEGSAPRTVGTSMAFDGRVVTGSIAGGCVEGAVVAACEEALAGSGPQTIEYGIEDETAFSVGLTCGGQLRIHVRAVAPGSDVHDRLRRAAAGERIGVATIIGDESLAAVHRDRIDALLAARIALGGTGLTTIDCDGAIVEVFVEVHTPPAELIIVGAMEYSAALAIAARALGYRVTVCDPRPLFTTARRFPGCEIVVAWPPEWLRDRPIDDSTVVCVLSHDARFDAEVIGEALESRAGYVGAMGSRRTHDRRVASLRERGIAESAIARLNSPIGLDLGASTPEETAVSILAEVIAARTGAAATPLREGEGAIHSRLGVPA